MYVCACRSGIAGQGYGRGVQKHGMDSKSARESERERKGDKGVEGE